MIRKVLIIVGLVAVISYLAGIISVRAETYNYCGVEKILIEKSKKKMTLLDCKGDVVETYTVRTGLNKGPKQCEGDKKTPEGIYKIKDKRDSKYVRFLEIDYPRAKDIKRAKELGCNPGNAVGIHYYNKEYTNDPSTLEGSLGCITVWNKSEIREIDSLVSVGTEVEILP